MSWTRGSRRAVLVVCVLLLTGSAGCGSGDARGSGASPTPVGSLLGDRDQEGRAYREVARPGAPGVGVEVQPGAAGGWDVRLTVRNFRFSPAGAAARAVAGHGLARLYVDGRPVARLRMPGYRLAGRLVPRGTHRVTARLYADDGTVWAVDGTPVESTADITASEPGPGLVSESGPGPGGASESGPGPGGASESGPGPTPGADARRTAGVHASDPRSRIGGRGSPEPAEKAS
ncbi:hypothetical protein [Streptomyces afghaniensis]|uniref:hypothetical protein n=1 Tax=Streptomyces afghaniensis TaxID=66865 RepID=UPI0027897ED8|nr:hypothetical protein [Streptomyces afghaniensis]MDQ1020759.1 hypothetical protein [Streptomyces afghaniensis]